MIRIACIALSVVTASSGCFVPEDNGKPANRKKNSPTKAKAKKVKRQLRALPYVNWVPVKPKDRKQRGVTRHHPKLAWQGLTLYNSLPRARAQLIDMAGKVVHSWSSRVGQPTKAELEWHRIWSHLDFIGWQHVEATPAGNLYAILHMYGVLKLDRRSRVLWLAKVPAHHDLDLTESGEIYVLTAEKRKIKRGDMVVRILDDHVVVISPRGKVLRRFSLLDTLRRHPPIRKHLEKKLDWITKHFATSLKTGYLMAHVLQKKKHNVKRTAGAFAEILTDRFRGTKRVELMLMTTMLPMDPLHANSLEILKRDVAGLGRKGDMLLSVRELDLVLVLDPTGKKLRWFFGPGVVQRQHQPSILDNGHLLVFDNGTFARRSRVLEIDPRTKKVVWSYQAKPPNTFYSPIRGGCQRLPNGNTLITESERGRVFEVTKGGKIAWEFFNPDLDDPFMARKRAPIYRMTRHGLDFRKNSSSDKTPK